LREEIEELQRVRSTARSEMAITANEPHVR